MDWKKRASVNSAGEFRRMNTETGQYSATRQRSDCSRMRRHSGIRSRTARRAATTICAGSHTHGMASRRDMPIIGYHRGGQWKSKVLDGVFVSGRGSSINHGTGDACMVTGKQKPRRSGVFGRATCLLRFHPAAETQTQQTQAKQSQRCRLGNRRGFYLGKREAQPIYITEVVRE